MASWDLHSNGRDGHQLYSHMCHHSSERVAVEECIDSCNMEIRPDLDEEMIKAET